MAYALNVTGFGFTDMAMLWCMVTECPTSGESHFYI